MGEARVPRLTLWALLLWCPLAVAQSQPPSWNVSLRADGGPESPLRGLALGGDYRHGFQLGERPATLSLTYGVRRDWLGAAGLDSGQSGALDLGWEPLPYAAVGVFGSLTWMNFDQDGADARLDSQDAATRRVGVRGTLAFDDRRQTLQGTVSWADNDAEGANFVSRAAATTLQYTQLLARRWSLVAGADYTRTRYTEFAADPERESALYGCRLALQGPLLPRLTASVSYALNRQVWNQDPLVRMESLLLSLSYRL